MTLGDRQLQGWGLSLLVHAVVAGIAAWLWLRPAEKPKAEQPLRWEVSMFGAPRTPPKQPAVEQRPLEQPEVAAEPPLEALPPSEIPSAAAMPASAAPAFDMPKAVFSGGGATVIGVPAPGTAALWPSGPVLSGPGPGAGLGGRSLAAPDFGAGLAPTVRIPPAYPMEARRKKIEGWVRVEMTVLEDGSVADARVKQAQPPGVFEQAALAAVARWKFRPPTENGKPVRRRAGQILRFDLAD